MGKYYRYTNQDSPMSAWGHAMMADDQNRVDHYGPHCYTLDVAEIKEKGYVVYHIADLEALIKTTWAEQQAEGYLPEAADEDYELTPQEVYELCNPEDIVESAGAFDRDLGCWLWANVLDPLDVDVVITRNGCIAYTDEVLEYNSENTKN